MSQKVYLWILKTGVILSFLCVFFVFKNLLFPYITSKQIPFNILIEVLLVFWLAFIIKYPQWSPFKNWQRSWPFSAFKPKPVQPELAASGETAPKLRPPKKGVPIVAEPEPILLPQNLITLSTLAFFVIILISCFTGVDFHMSFWSNAERMLGVYHILHFFALYLIAITVFRDWLDWQIVFTALLVFAVGVAIGSFNGSVYSTLGNSLYAAVFMIFAFYFILLLFFHKEGNDGKKSYSSWKWFYFLAIPFLYIQFYKVNKAGDTIGLLMGAAAFILLFGAINKRRVIRVASWVLTLSVVGIIAFAFVYHTNPIITHNRFLSKFNTDRATFQTRLLSWEAGAKDFHNHWLLGTGFGNYAITFDRYFQAKFYNYAKTETYFDRAHNNIVDLTSTTGILGILAYLSIFAAVGIYLVRALRRGRIKPVEFCLIASLLVAYFVQNLDVFDSFVTYMCLLIVLGYIHWLSNTGQDRGNTRALLATGGPAGFVDREIFVLIGAGLIAAFLIYNFAVMPLRTFAGVIQGQMNFSQGDIATGVQLYRKALANNTPIDKDGRSMFLRAVADYAWNISKLPQAQAVDIIAFAVAEGEKNLAYNPRDSLMQMELARVNDVGFKVVSDPALRSAYAKAALEHIDKSIAASPERVPVYFIKAQMLIGQSQTDAGISALEYAKSIKTDFFDTDCQLAQAYLIKENQLRQAKAATSTINAAGDKGWSAMDICLDHNGAGNLAIADVIKMSIDHYIDSQDLDKVIQLYEQLVQYESNAQYYVALARLYQQKGAIDKAIAAAQQAEKIDPALKADADAYIKQLQNQQ
ncbi:MAG: O-antigen ligase family protein [Patescibacteria group bacterium]|nr:O-antigen ligase family protein [Patescibacteria group bacterium]